MAESTSSYTCDDIKAEMGFVAGYGRTAASWNSAQQADLAAWFKRGSNQAFNPPRLPDRPKAYEWSFLKPVSSLTFQLPYGTGTLTLTNGSTTVTLAGGTWPSWAASGVLVIPGYQPIDVASRSSGSVIVLTAAWTGATASTYTYSLNQWSYALPDNFAYLEKGFIYANDQYRPPIQIIDEFQIRELRQASGISSGRPARAALRVSSAVPGTIGQRWMIDFDVAPDAAYVLTYRYRILTDITTTTNYPYGGAAFAECLLASCLEQASRFLDPSERDRYRQDFLAALAAAIDVDASRAPDTLGYNADRSDAALRPCSDQDIGLTIYGTPFS